MMLMAFKQIEIHVERGNYKDEKNQDKVKSRKTKS